MIVSISLSKEEEQLFKNYAEFSGLELSILFKRVLLERIEYKRQSKNVQKWEFKNVQFYSFNTSFNR